MELDCSRKLNKTNDQKENRIHNLKKIIEYLKKNPNQWSIDLIKHFSKEEREIISLETKTRILYIGQEVVECQKEEESILYDILPDDEKNLNKLNILNIGAGGRRIHTTLINLDFQRDLQELSHNGHIPNTILSDMDNLIFKDDSIDAIIALHIWEHSMDPVKTLKEWIRVVKPGCKIGIVVPNFRYNWSASNDRFIYGHKWNTEKDITLKMLKQYFPDIEIIKIDTFKNKLSYNLVIKKPGQYVKNNSPVQKSGYDLDGGEHKDIGYYYHDDKLHT